jgi:CRISPR-associated exonuclease Cas4
LEFHASKNGIILPNRHGTWRPYIVEHKKGRPKKNLSDVMQLVAQVMCVEEMYQTSIAKSALYYHEIRERKEIQITCTLRTHLEEMIESMQRALISRKTPPAPVHKGCKRCSLREQCWPKLTQKKKSTSNYLTHQWERALHEETSE